MKQIKYVDLHEMKELMPIKIQEQALSLRKTELLHDKSLNVNIHLAMDPTIGDLWVIRGLEEYLAYKEINNNQAVPCIVHQNMTTGDQWLTFLCYLLNMDSPHAMDIHKCALKVFQENQDRKDYVYKYVENHTGIHPIILNTYLFHPDIPDHLKTGENILHLDLLNKVQELEEFGISKVVRDQLTYFAVEPFPSRLTEEKLEVVKWMINETDGFRALPQGQQIYLLAFAMEYKKYLLHHFQKMIDTFYDEQYEKFISNLHSSTEKTDLMQT
ncbi:MULTISPECIES: hypothetical protein [Bacillaceae]|uniref:Uncharacterized protein n=1 Tax=Evansella alkalicola TaxID=745819 RepID=A0ABS6JQS4_9BACI|nr:MULTISPECIES: hypothetical protein [Bacillaceae]MBU9720906.1 hypothetical protein [Bacillus alkalicola]